MKKCELCKSVARIYCDSDRASLCWSCDAKVHSANFLVARHSRCLLCHACQSPTPWSATGEKLYPSTASVCGRCVVEVEDVSDDDNDREERVGGNGGEIDTDGDGQNSVVVPWSSTPAPPAASSSSSEEFFIRDGGVLLKRKRRNIADLNSQDDLDCSSANVNHKTPSSRMPELASEDERTSFHSNPLTSEATVGKLKRIRYRTIISGDYMSAPLQGTNKSTRTAELDLNLPALP